MEHHCLRAAVRSSRWRASTRSRGSAYFANAESFRRAHGPSDNPSDARADVFSDDHANIASNNRAADACADGDADVNANDDAHGPADHLALLGR